MKAIIKITVCAACLTITCLYSRQTQDSVSELVNSNVEALASGEHSTTFYCYGSGSVDCYGVWVEMKISGLSLD